MAKISVLFCLTVVTIGIVQGQYTTSQQVVNAASANFDRSKAEISTKLNALLSVIKIIQGLFADTGSDLGGRLTNEYYVEGTQGLIGTADFIRPKDIFVATTTANVIFNLPSQGNEFYKACIAKNAEIAALSKASTEISQQISKIVVVDLTYKSNLYSCRFVKFEQAPSCVANALNSNPLPQVNQSIINGLSLINGDSKCIEEAAEKLKEIGTLTVDSVRKVYPKEFLFMVPAKFDPLEGRVFGKPSVIVNPTVKLAEAKSALEQARKALQDAWDEKNVNLTSSKAYLDGLVSEFNAIVDRVPVQSEAAICMTVVKGAITGNQNEQGLNLFNCINNIQAAPSQQALSDQELSIIDRETRENVASSTVQCFKSLRNVFYPTELQCCLAEAQDDYKVYLDGVILNAETYSRKAADVKAQIEQCKLSALIAAKKQFNVDIGAFEKCLKIYTKITVNSPVTNPYISTNTN